MSAPIAEPTITTNWPAGFPSDKPGLHGFAVREVNAPADSVFAWIRRVDLHPEFYGDLKWVKRIGGSWPQLDTGSKLTFIVGATFVPMVAVTQCDTELRSFAWGSKLPGFEACHAFTVKPIDEHRSLIRSEELWVGAATKALPFATPIIQKIQTRWAEAIAAAANAHPQARPRPKRLSRAGN